MPRIASATRKFAVRWPGWYPILFLLAGSIALIVIYLFDPELENRFLPCPFRSITGLLCPGCGAQRAIHDLLHGRVLEAFSHNAALVLAIPLLGLQWVVPRLLRSQKDASWDNRVVYAWLILLIGWGVLRNVIEAPHFH